MTSPNPRLSASQAGARRGGLKTAIGQIIAAVLSLGVLVAAFIFAGIFIFGALLIGAALFVAFRIWRLFNKPDPEARQEFILNTIQRGMNRRSGGGSATPNGGSVIDGEAEIIDEPNQRS